MKKLLMALALLPLMAGAYETWTDPSTGIRWTYTILDDGTISLGDGYSATAVNRDTSGSLDILPTINGRAVTSIGDFSFQGCAGLTSVVIPDGVTSIGEHAFASCVALKTVSIPASVENLGGEDYCSNPLPVKGVFEGCDCLMSIEVAAENSYYADVGGVLYDRQTKVLITCPNGRSGSMTIPLGVTSIGDSAFEDCRGVTSVVIPSSVASIGDGAFCGCSGLTSVSICEGVAHIGAGAFSGCRGLSSVIIPLSVATIGDYAFSDCSGLMSIAIPSSVMSIGYSAFDGCGGLSSIFVNADNKAFCSIGGVLYDKAKTILIKCPEGMRGVLRIPASVEEIAEGALAISDGWYYVANIELQSIEVESPNSTYDSVDGILYDKKKAELVWCPAGKEGAVVISSGTMIVGEAAFAGCSGLTSVTIPEGVMTVGDFAFCGCSGLTSVTMPEGVMSIGHSAFRGCKWLTSMMIPSSVTSIGMDVFAGCKGLKEIVVDASNRFYCSRDGVLYDQAESKLICCPDGITGAVTIPMGVTGIDWESLGACSGLTAIRIDALNSEYSSLDGVVYDKSQRVLIRCPPGKTGTVTIPSSVVDVAWGAFSGCSSLSDIVVAANNLEYSSQDGILYDKRKSTLIRCPGGKTGAITIPSIVTSIEDYAFEGCSKLTSMTMHEGVIWIGYCAFEGCNRIRSMTIPSSVISIGVDGWGSQP